jgi:acyl-CoA reductase-like NAD-dependent aldehyde dehydrogenase
MVSLGYYLGIEWHINMYLIGNHPELAPRTVEDNDNIKLSVRYSPIGVVAAICPWNYPVILAIGKIAAALVTGNCVIVKPSPFTPYSILKFTELVKSIFPPGVIQAVNGDDMAGPFLCDHSGIQKISFTGSISTGKKIMAAASKTLKRITLELGGNDACIVCPDVDISVAASQIAVGSFLNSGQFCMGSKRIYVHKDIYQPFMQAITDVVKSWKVSPSVPDADNTLGPVQNEMQYNIVKEFFEDSYKYGYTFALGEGTVPDSDSFVIRPAIIDNPPDKSKIVTEEPFGKDLNNNNIISTIITGT